MIIYLTNKKKQSLKEICIEMQYEKDSVSIRKVARLLGKISSSFPGVKFGRLHYRKIERDKTEALKIAKGNFEKKMSLSSQALEEIKWWLENVDQSYSDIHNGNPDITINTDASKTGWGACSLNASTGGMLSLDEQDEHINVTELKAVLYGLQTLAKDLSATHIKIMSDNTTTVSAINKMGTSRSHNCDEVAKDIWEWAIERNNWLTAAHIPGIFNEEADRLSRKFEIHTEWMLNKEKFQETCKQLDYTPTVDLFASRLNNQTKEFVSYRPDPECVAVNAFTLDWSSLKFYAFPPFNCISRVLNKIIRENAVGLIVVPDWPTQPWYPLLKKLIIKKHLLFSSPTLLQQPNYPMMKHPLHKKLKLMVCLVSGNHSVARSAHQR